MPRANRHFLPGYIWHITHRCHRKEFLLNDVIDRKNWLSLLHKARDRFEITVLGYSVTCNHIHLLLENSGIPNAIPRSMQFVQSQVAQSFNRRTGRINAFWGDRYRATAIESGVHLFRCLAYIDLNMVRAGVVKHPSQWQECGFNELQHDRIRNGIINQNRLAALLGCKDLESLQKVYKHLINETLQKDLTKRDERWTESIAIGSRTFTERFAFELGDRLKSRSVTQTENEEDFVVREENTVSHYAMNSYKDSGEELIALYGDENEVEFDLSTSLLID